MRKFAIYLLMLQVHQAFAAPVGRTNFLTYGPGAAEEAMGDAAVAATAGPQSLYYNSAGLGSGPSALTGEWTRLAPGMSYSWLGASANLGFAGVGLGLISLDLGDITARSSLSDPGASVSSYQRAYLIGTGREVLPGLRAGTTFGLLDYNLASFATKSLFTDLGMSYQALDSLNLGLAIKNAYFSGLNFGGETERYPREFRLGGAWSNHGFTFAGQANKVSDGSALNYGFGAAYTLLKILTFRAGFHGYPRFGFGFCTSGGRFSVDFSYQARAVAASERVTLSYFFKPQSEDDGPKDPYVELQERAKSLADYYKEESKRFLETTPDRAQETLKKALALNPADSDTASALSSVSGRRYPSVRLFRWNWTPWEKRRRRLYLRFAVAYADGPEPEACALGNDFLRRWPEDTRSSLIAQLVGETGCVVKKTKEEQKQ